MARAFLVLISILVSSVAHAAGDNLSGWHPAASDLCLEGLDAAGTTAPQKAVASAVSLLRSAAISDLGLLDAARDAGTRICIEPRPDPTRGYFDPELNLIALGANLNDGERAFILLHELRHLEQFRKGSCRSVLYDVRDEVRFVYVLEADSSAIATHAAWLLRDGGQPAVWQAAMAMTEYAGILKTYEQAATGGGMREDAIAAAFAAWLQSDWLRQVYDRSTCASYYDELDRTKRLQSYAVRSDDELRGICRLPDGTYPCVLPPP